MSSGIFNAYRLALAAGTVLLLLGLQFRVIHSVELTRDTTAVLARWTEPEPDSAQGAARQVAVAAARPRATVTPPPWLGLSLMSAGVVAIAYGLLGRRWK